MILAGRSEGKGAEAMKELMGRVPNAKARVSEMAVLASKKSGDSGGRNRWFPVRKDRPLSFASFGGGLSV